MKKIIVILFVLSLSFCKNVENSNLKKVDQFHKIKELAELSTIEYKMTKIIKSSDSNFWGSRKILFKTSAKVKAGIDLKSIKKEDIKITKNKVSIRLPKPKILSLQMNPGDIKEIYSDVGSLRKNFKTNEKEKILTLGEMKVKQSLKESNILNHAKDNAKRLVYSWLKMSGFKDIEIEFNYTENQTGME